MQQERRVVAVVVGEGVAVVAAAEGLEAAVEAAEVAAVEAAAVEDSEAAEVAAEVVVEAAAVEAAAVEAVAVVGGKIFPVRLAFHNRRRQCTRAHAHTCTRAHMHTRTRAHMHTRTQAHMHTCTHAHTNYNQLYFCCKINTNKTLTLILFDILFDIFSKCVFVRRKKEIANGLWWWWWWAPRVSTRVAP